MILYLKAKDKLVELTVSVFRVCSQMQKSAWHPENYCSSSLIMASHTRRLECLSPPL